MAEIGHIANGLDPMTRRLVWMAWVDGKGIAEIAEGTGYPVERVEWLMDYVVQKATEAVTGHSHEPRPEEPAAAPEEEFQAAIKQCAQIDDLYPDERLHELGAVYWRMPTVEK